MRSICGGARYYTGIACRPWTSGIYKVLIIFTDPHCVVKNFTVSIKTILGDPGAASWDDRIFMGESLQQERESPWALTFTERVPEAFESPNSDWPEKYFLANQRRGTAGGLSCLLTRGCFPHRTP